MFASSLSNVALMHRMKGEFEDANILYTDSLQLYEKLGGKSSQSYATALMNLGICYKLQAVSSKGMEKMQLLERAEEALLDARMVKKELNQNREFHSLNHENKSECHRDYIHCCMNLASVWNLNGDTGAALKELKSLLEICRRQYGEVDIINGTILNNLGLVQKGLKESMQDAEESYREALDIRSKILGENHPETIVTMHNLAECYLALNKVDEATKIQEEILKIVGYKEEEPVGEGAPEIHSSVTVNTEKANTTNTIEPEQPTEPEKPVLKESVKVYDSNPKLKKKKKLKAVPKKKTTTEWQPPSSFTTID
jgi:tetratricopeptide (TPR) repeat protein